MSTLHSENSEVKAECPRYDTKQPDSEAPFHELWGMRSITLLPLFPGPLWTGVVVSVKVPFMGQIDLFENIIIWLECKQKITFGKQLHKKS